MYSKEIQNSIFPIQCSNPECNCSYDIEAFAHIYMLWGYILLTDGQYHLIGFTCPKCNHTTLNKYSNAPRAIYLNHLEEFASAYQPNYDDGSALKYYVPFSQKFLTEDLIAIIQDYHKKNPKAISRVPLFSVPSEFQSCLFSSMTENKADICFYEEDFQILLEIENQHGFKVFPRIIPADSVYRTSEFLLTAVDNSTDPNLPDNFFEIAHGALERLYVSGFEIKDEREKYYQKHYEDLILNDLTPDEFKDMDRDLYSWNTVKFIHHLPELINDYKTIRNRIDFELICYNKLFNKYARILYYQKGLAEFRQNIEQTEYEDFMLSQNLEKSNPFDDEVNLFKENVDDERANVLYEKAKEELDLYDFVCQFDDIPGDHINSPDEDYLAYDENREDGSEDLKSINPEDTVPADNNVLKGVSDKTHSEDKDL